MRDERIFIPTLCIYYIAFALGLHNSDISEERFSLLLLILLLCIIVCYILYKVKARLLQVWSRIKRALTLCMNYIRSHKSSLLLAGIMIVICLLLLPYHSYYQNSNTLCESFSSLMINVVGAFAALFITYIMLKPKFSINTISAHSLNNQIHIVVLNKSWFAKLFAVHVELSYQAMSPLVDDEVLSPIELDSEANVSVLANKLSEDGVNKYFVFHTPECFYKQWKKLKCRVSATNTISNVVDIKDFYIEYDNVRWGEYIGDSFYSVDDLYLPAEHYKVSRLITFNELVSKILRPRSSMTNEALIVFDNVTKLLDDFPKNYINEFPCLQEIPECIADMKAHFIELKKILQECASIRPVKIKKRDLLLRQISKELYSISYKMEKSIERKKV